MLAGVWLSGSNRGAPVWTVPVLLGGAGATGAGIAWGLARLRPLADESFGHRVLRYLSAATIPMTAAGLILRHVPRFQDLPWWGGVAAGIGLGASMTVVFIRNSTAIDSLSIPWKRGRVWLVIVLVTALIWLWSAGPAR